MKIRIIDIVNISLKSITKKTYADFIKEIRDVGMEENNRNDGFYPHIPKYDKLQSFDYIIDKNEDINLKIFGIDNNIIEIIIIIGIGLPRLSFMSPGKRIYNEIVESLKISYGDGYSINYEKKNHIFENDEIKIDIVYGRYRRQQTDILTITMRNNKFKTKLEDLLSKMKP